MRKEERKARIKAMKLARKEAKRALRDASRQTHSASSGQPASESDRAATPEQDLSAGPRQAAVPVATEAPASPPAAHTLEAPSPGSEAWALSKLIGAAEFLGRFVAQAESALETIERPKLEAILKQHEPEPEQAGPRKRPRGAPHPIFVLYKLAVGAARLLQRVIKATNPSLFTMSPDKADLLGLARASGDYIRKLERARGRAMA